MPPRFRINSGRAGHKQDPYKTYVALTDKGKEVAERIKSCVEDVSESV
ncbi:MAG: hypothetical protein ACE5K4_10180 [Candidatus Hydrothermarchaeota archaeon]